MTVGSFAVPAAVFANLPQDKQKRVIEAALQEFAVQGFEQASTNRIAEQADIAKGSIFKYFGSKENLFGYLYLRESERIASEFARHEAQFPAELPAALRKAAEIKLQYFRDNPRNGLFLLRAAADDIRLFGGKYRQQSAEQSAEANKAFLAQINRHNLSLPLEAVMTYANWFFEGMFQELVVQQTKAPNRQIWDKLDQATREFCQILEQGIMRKD